MFPHWTSKSCDFKTRWKLWNLKKFQHQKICLNTQVEKSLHKIMTPQYFLVQSSIIFCCARCRIKHKKQENQHAIVSPMQRIFGIFSSKKIYIGPGVVTENLSRCSLEIIIWFQESSQLKHLTIFLLKYWHLLLLLEPFLLCCVNIQWNW